MIMKPTFKQLTTFIETTEAKLDLTEFSKCIAYLYDSEGGEVSSIDFITSTDICNPVIYIGEEKYNLTDKQLDFVIIHLDKEIAEDLQTWNEMKNDTYNVRDDQNNY